MLWYLVRISFFNPPLGGAGHQTPLFGSLLKSHVWDHVRVKRMTMSAVISTVAA